MSPHKQTGIMVLFGRLTVELEIGFRNLNRLALEQICLDAPESTIHKLDEFEGTFIGAKEQVSAAYEVEAVS